MKCTKELSSYLRQESTSMNGIFPLREHYSRMEDQSLHMEVSSPLREQPSCMEEQSLIAEELTSQTQLEVSAQIFAHQWSFHILHDINLISHLLTSCIMAVLILVRGKGLKTCWREPYPSYAIVNPASSTCAVQKFYIVKVLP